MSAFDTDQFTLRLIKQDLIHNHLITGLDSMGLDASSSYCLEIMEMVAALMGIPKGQISDAWSDIYQDWMHATRRYEIGELSQHLEKLTEDCFAALKNRWWIEQSASSN